MRIVTAGGRLKIADNPYPFWAFYSLFVLGGMTALTLSLLDRSNLTATLVGFVIGLANVVAALWMMKREPASVVELDRNADRVSVRRWGIMGGARSSYPLRSLVGADVETTEHTDGGTVYRPRLRFANAESIPVSLFWYQTAASSRDVVDSVKQYVGSRAP